MDKNHLNNNRYEENQIFNGFQEKIGLKFSNINLLKQAFTHSSYVNEQRESGEEDNERLEFLGDAVLELAVSHFLFQTYPDMEEGEMTKLRAAIVCEPSLVSFAEELGFGQLMRLGKGEELTGGRKRPALLADAFEAFIGAIYLDQGLEQVFSFLQQYVFPKVEAGAFTALMDYKSQLQEYVQREGLGKVEYEIIAERGPAHEKEFFAEVRLNGKTYGQGSGKSKKEAEQQAAHMALKKLMGNRNVD